jgi:UDP-glucose 4-epimerase
VKDARQTFLGHWLRQMLEGEELVVFGDGEQLRDFNFVDDAVDAFLLAATCDEATGKIYNLGSDERISLKDLAHLMVEINGRGSYRLQEFPPERRAIDIGDYYGDFGKIREELGWQPQIALADGLRRTLDFLREHGTLYWDRT